MVKFEDLKLEFDELKASVRPPRTFHCPFFEECQAGPYTRQSTLNGGYQQIFLTSLLSGESSRKCKIFEFQKTFLIIWFCMKINPYAEIFSLLYNTCTVKSAKLSSILWMSKIPQGRGKSKIFVPSDSARKKPVRSGIYSNWFHNSG